MKPDSQIYFRDITKLSWTYVRRYPLRLTCAAIGLVGSAIAELIAPVISGWLIDYLAANIDRPINALGGAIEYIGLFLLCGICFWFFRHTGWFFWAGIVSSGMRDITSDVFSRVQNFSTQWHINTFAGATVTKIKRGMRGFQLFIDLFHYDFIPLILVVLGMTILVTWKHALLGGFVAVSITLYAALSIALSMRYVMPANRRENEQDNLVGANLADALTCNATVKAFASDTREETKFREVMQQFASTSLQAWQCGEYTSIVQNICMTLFKGAFIISALWLWLRGTFSVGDFAFVVASYQLISGHLRNIGQNIRRLYDAASDMEDITRFFQLAPGDVDEPGATTLQVSRGEISFDNVSFYYEKTTADAPIFKNFSITIHPGERVALVGHSGGGKSTFVKLLQRLYKPTAGHIVIDGQKTCDVTQASLRSEIALVPQDPILFHRSLAENIAYAKPGATTEEIEKVAKLSHSYEFIENLPQKLDTLVGERGVKLSGGERQRIAIARAMLSDARILILDEATSSLDSQSEQYIQSALDALMNNKTIIAIAHRLSTIKKADRILVIENGDIVEEGDHNYLLQQENGIYKSLFELQAGGFIGE